MSRKVYANGREVVSGGNHGKVVGAFPDVCNSPPGPPAGPVPVPYADSSSARDLKKGSKRVKIGGKPVGLRDQSFFKSAPLGNEAATKSFGGSLLTHTIGGKTQFGSWSHDVKVEGKGVQRHRDLTTSNHGSYPGGTPPTPNLSSEQKLALSRVKEGQCPCCGASDCPAAFRAGEEPLSMREFYGMDSKGTGRARDLAEQYKLAKNVRRTQCQCTVSTAVFPSPPCDVFRAENPAKKKRIERKWNNSRNRYIEGHEHRLHDKFHFLDLMIASHPAGEQKKIRAAGKMRRSDRKDDPWGKLWNKYNKDSERAARINHLVPKEAGGCPTGPGNLQPQQLLCLVCQDIDQMMTDHWQG